MFDPTDSNRDALEKTLAASELPAEAAALVALARTTADMLDNFVAEDKYHYTANVYLRQLKELQEFAPEPEPEVEAEDPFDVLAKSLAGEA